MTADQVTRTFEDWWETVGKSEYSKGTWEADMCRLAFEAGVASQEAGDNHLWEVSEQELEAARAEIERLREALELLKATADATWIDSDRDTWNNLRAASVGARAVLERTP